MLLDNKINELQNLTKRKIKNSEIAKILGLNTAQAVVNRITRKQELKEWEALKLDEAFKNEINQNETGNKPFDCVEIPIHGNVFASMGFGIEVYDETQTGMYSISKKLANDIGINLESSSMIFAKGDSMEPTIIGGDSLLVNASQKEVYDGSIYCVRIDGQLYAKRLQKVPPKKIKVISDNKEKYDAFYVDLTQEIDFDFEIIGEVRWWGRVAR